MNTLLLTFFGGGIVSLRLTHPIHSVVISKYTYKQQWAATVQCPRSCQGFGGLAQGPSVVAISVERRAVATFPNPNCLLVGIQTSDLLITCSLLQLLAHHFDANERMSSGCQ